MTEKRLKMENYFVFSKFIYCAMFIVFALPLTKFINKNYEDVLHDVTLHKDIIVFCLLLVLVVVLFHLYLQNIYNYWVKLGVTFPKPFPVFGHTLRRFGISMHILKFYDDAYYNYNGKDFCGFYEFLNPGLIIGNLELIRNITVKDFNHFANRRVFPMDKINPIANEMLSNTTGEKWRQTRTAISPVFSSYKLKQIYPLVCQQGNAFIKLLKVVGRDQKEFKMRELCGKFTMDTIASCAFGIECDAMNSDQATFTKMAAKIFVLSPARALKIITLLTAPFLAQLTQRVGIEFTSEEFRFFQKVISKTLHLRKEKGIRRGDYLDLMMETNKLSETALTAQAVLFLLAGYNNIASALSFTLHLLAVHQDTQEELRTKLQEANRRQGEDFDCETLQKIPLLDGVVKESLRLYPADPTLDRICTKDYQIPGTNVVIKEKQRIVIPIWCVHRDPSHWNEPESFNPKRFLDINEREFGPFLPFGAGPRQCIGLKFVYLVVKVGLQKILSEYKVVPSPNTVHPPPLNPKCFLSLTPVNGLPLSLIPLNGVKR